MSEPARETARKRAPASSKRAPASSKRVRIRRRAMPCPSCDAEIDRDHARSQPCTCPACGCALLPVEAARTWRQASAGALDLVILSLSAGPIAWGLHRLIDPVPLAPGARGLDLALSVFAADVDLLLQRIGPLLVLAALYFMFTISWIGRTLGQRLLSLRIVDVRGRQPSVLRTGLRTFAQLVGTLAAALGPLWSAVDSERRALHDLVAGTYVVRSA